MQSHFSNASILITIACALITLALGSCGEDATSPPPAETASAPSEITGPDSTETMKREYYCCSGASCSEGHELEHQFDWGDGDSTSWLPSTCASHEWTLPGHYGVKARARCKTHSDVVSAWCAACNVQVVAPAESITTPDGPSGSLSSTVGQMEIYCTGGATSNMGHLVQYQFDWGDGYSSSWSASECASHSWSASGSYTVKAQARCATHMHIVSPWSDAIEVSVVQEEVSPPPNPPSGYSGICPEKWEPYSTGGAASNLGHTLEYRFDWGDGSYSPWSTSTSASHSWADLGTFEVRAQARCSTHTAIVSEWSDAKTVRTVETISTPGRPNGPTTTIVGSTETYCGGLGISSCSHPRQRQWKVNGVEMNWGYDSCTRISFPTAGMYYIAIRTRCARHTDAVSDWSITFKVTVE